MAQNLSVGNIVQATMVCTSGPQVSLNRLIYKVLSITGAPKDQDLADAVDNSAGPALVLALANNAKYLGTLAQIIWPLPVYKRVAQNTNSGFGAFGGEMMASQTCGIITWESVFAGPAFRGRMYVPFPSINAISAGETPTAGYVTAIGNLATAIRTLTAIGSGGNTASVSFSIYNRTTHVATVVNSQIPRAKWATQKKRGDYGKQFTSPI